VLASFDATDAQVQWSEKEGLSIEPGIARRIHDGVDALSAGLVAQRRFFQPEPVPFR
jgi:FMN reductase